MTFNKPIYLCLQGPSIKLLDEHIEYFREHDVMWASLNRFSIIENKILNKINKQFDMIYCSSPQRFAEEYFNLKCHPGLIVSNYEVACNTDVKIHITSNWGYGFSSLFAFLATILNLGRPPIYLFGVDGFPEERRRYTDKTQLYYSEEDMKEDIPARKHSIAKDTVVMNRLFWAMMNYWGICGRKNTQIYNMNPDSYVKCFDFKDIKALL